MNCWEDRRLVLLKPPIVVDLNILFIISPIPDTDPGGFAAPENTRYTLLVSVHRCLEPPEHLLGTAKPC